MAPTMMPSGREPVLAQRRLRAKVGVGTLALLLLVMLAGTLVSAHAL